MCTKGGNLNHLTHVAPRQTQMMRVIQSRGRGEQRLESRLKPRFRTQFMNEDRQERKLRRTAIFLIVALGAGILTASAVYGQEQVVAGPVSDTLKALRAVRAEQAQSREQLGGIGRKLETFGSRFSRIDGEQKRFWESWQEERTKRNEADEKTKQAIADMKKNVAESQKHQPLWRMVTVVAVCLTVLTLWFKK